MTEKEKRAIKRLQRARDELVDALSSLSEVVTGHRAALIDQEKAVSEQVDIAVKWAEERL